MQEVNKYFFCILVGDGYGGFKIVDNRFSYHSKGKKLNNSKFVPSYKVTSMTYIYHNLTHIHQMQFLSTCCERINLMRTTLCLFLKSCSIQYILETKYIYNFNSNEKYINKD